MVETKVKITRKQLERILKEELSRLNEQEDDLSGFWDHDVDKVVEEDGKLMALGSAPIVPMMTSAARAGAWARASIKIAHHLEGGSKVFSRELTGTKILKTKTLGRYPVCNYRDARLIKENKYNKT